MALYDKVESPGDPLPANAEPFNIRDDKPTDGELQEAVQGLSNGRTDGASSMCAEDLKEWLGGIRAEEKAEAEGKEGHKGAGDR